MGEVNSFCVNYIARAPGQAAHAKLLAGTLGNGRRIVQQHVHQRFAHAAVTGNEQGNDLVGETVEELVVNGADGFIGPLGRDDHGDVPLRGTLGGGAYRDAVTAQGGQHAAGGAAVAQHIVPDDADDGKAFFHAQRIQFPEGNFVGEAGIGRPPGLLGVGCGNGNAHGVHGRGLRDEDDVDAGARKGVKEAGTEARYAHHAAPFQRDERQAMGVGNADGAPLRPRRIFLHQRARLIRMEGVFYINGNALCHNGLDGGRVNYLGAKMGKLLRGAVGDMRNGAGRRHHLRMGGHDARNIGPNLYPAGVDAHGEQRRGVV